MSIWSGIKTALNSTLGTSEFKPLDKLIRFEGKNLVVSDTAFLKPSITAKEISTDYGNQTSGKVVDVITIKPRVSGSVRMVGGVTIYSTTANTPTYANIVVYVNGVQKYDFSKNYTFASGSTYLSTTITGDIAFNAGDTVSLKFKVRLGSSSDTSLGRATLSSIQFNAITTDNLIEVVSV